MGLRTPTGIYWSYGKDKANHAEGPHPANLCYLTTAGVPTSAEGSSVPRDSEIALSHICSFLNALLTTHGYNFLHNSNLPEGTHTICRQRQQTRGTLRGRLL